MRSVSELHSTALSFVLETGLASGAAELNMAVHSNLKKLSDIKLKKT